MVIGAILFFIAGLVIVLLGINEIRGTLSARNWKTTEGQILKSELVAQTSSAGGDGKPITRYEVFVEYSYTVANQQYIGNRRSFSDSIQYRHEHAKTIVDLYPVGKILDVYYSPNNPEQSALGLTVQKSSYYICIFGLVFIGIAINIYSASKTNPKTVQNEV